MYGVSIDRSFESAKTVKGITDFSDFESIYDENKMLQYIVTRNQTRMLEKICESSDLKKLWKRCLGNKSIGVICNLSIKYATTVP